MKGSNILLGKRITLTPEQLSQHKQRLNRFNSENQKESNESDKIYYLISWEWIKDWTNFCENEDLQRNMLMPINNDIVTSDNSLIRGLGKDDLIFVSQSLYNSCFKQYQAYVQKRIAYLFLGSQNYVPQKIIPTYTCQIKYLFLTIDMLQQIKATKKNELKFQTLNSLTLNNSLLDLKEQISKAKKSLQNGLSLNIWFSNSSFDDIKKQIFYQLFALKTYSQLSIKGVGTRISNSELEMRIQELNIDSSYYFIIEAAPPQKSFLKFQNEEQCQGCGHNKLLSFPCLCQKIKYCSEECKRQHWVYHQKNCKFTNQRIDMTPKQKSRNGLVGLNNLGNTCFMNSALQCLANTEPLRDYFLNQNFSRQWKNKQNPNSITKIFALFIRDMWCQTSEAIAPIDIKKIVSSQNSMYSEGVQQDSQEFMAFLLEMLHQDLNRSKKQKFSTMHAQEKNVEKFDLQKFATNSWHSYAFKNQSIIIEKMKGQLLTRLICQICEYQNFKMENYLALGLPIPEHHKVHTISYQVIFQNFYEQPLQTFITYKDDDFSQWKKSAAIQLRKRPEFLKFYILTENQNIYDFQNTTKNKILSLLSFNEQKVYLIEMTPIQYQFDLRVQLPLLMTKEEKAKPKPLWHKYPLFFDLETTKGIQIYKRILKLLYNSVYKYSERNCEFRDLSYGEYERQMMKNRPFQLVMKSQKITKREHKKFRTSFGNSIEINDGDLLKDVLRIQILKKKKLQIPTLQFVPQEIQLQELIHYLNAKEFELEAKFNDEQMKQFFIFQNLKISRKSLKQPHNYQTKRQQQYNIPLQACFEELQFPNLLEGDDAWWCPKCASKQPSLQLIQLYKAPQILIVHLRRFRMREKYKCNVVFPFKLDITKFLVDKISMTSYLPYMRKKNIIQRTQFEKTEDVDILSKPIYQLYAVNNHIGGLNGGHYTACIKNNNKWYRFNDKYVSEMKESQVQSPDAYMLFYKRVSPYSKKDDLN